MVSLKEPNQKKVLFLMPNINLTNAMKLLQETAQRFPLKNNLSLKEIIKGLIEDEPTVEVKLDLLTSIGITSRRKEIFKACESIRNELAPASPRKKKANDVSQPGILLDGRGSRRSKSDNARSLDKESKGDQQ